MGDQTLKIKNLINVLLTLIGIPYSPIQFHTQSIESPFFQRIGNRSSLVWAVRGTNKSEERIKNNIANEIYLIGDLAKISADNAKDLEQIADIRYSPWDLVLDVEWSSEGDLLFVSSGEKIHVYRIDQYQPMVSFHTGALTHSLAFHPNKNLLASGSRDGMLRLWEIPGDSSSNGSEPSPILSIRAHPKGVNSVVFSPDGKIIASGGNNAAANFWSVETGENLGTVVGGTFSIPAIEFLDNGNELAVVNGGFIRLREVDSERISGTFQAEQPVFCIALNQDESVLVAGDIENMLSIWNTEDAFRTGKEVYPEPIFIGKHSEETESFRALIWDIEIDPGDRLIASAGGDSTVRIWDISNGEQIVTLYSHTSGATSAAFHPSGRALVTGSLDGTVKFWGVIP